jgi:hypothetical protein
MLILPELLNGLIPAGDVAGIPHAQADDVTLEFGPVIEFDPATGSQNDEYFTIVNPSSVAVDASGWQIQGSAHVELAPGTVIAAGQSLYLSPDVAAFRSRTDGPSGNQGLFVQSFEGHLSNAGDTLELLNPAGEIVAQASYQGGSVSRQHDLRITEINYNPFPAMLQFGELDTDNDSYEFVEISNTGAFPVDLAGVQLVELMIDDDRQGVSFTFPGGQLNPGEQVVVVKSEAAFRSRYGDAPRVAGEYAGKLSNGGEFLTLWDAARDTVQQFRYNDAQDWPERPDGDGSSLELIDHSHDFDRPESWRASSQFGGSPGSPGQEPVRDVVINEVLSRTVAPAPDQIELYNDSDQTIDLAGWYLSDGNNYFKFQIPDGAPVIGPGEFRVFDERQLGFGFKGSESDDAWLVATDDAGRPIRFVDHVEFAAASASGVSFGRWPNGSGPLVPMVNTTFGQANSGPAAGDLNGDQQLNVADIDLLCTQVHQREPDLTADVNADGAVDGADLIELVERILNTSFGDANLDGVFNSSDLVKVFQAGTYEDAFPLNARWDTGDWNCDRDFNSSDLVVAFQRGGYEAVARRPLATGIRLQDLALATWLRDEWGH